MSAVKEDELVPLASFQGEYEAKIVQSILESGGIESVSYTHLTLPTTPYV